MFVELTISDLNKLEIGIDRLHQSVGLSYDTRSDIVNSIAMKRKLITEKSEALQKQRMSKIKCFHCMDSKQVESHTIGYDSIMKDCPYCK